MSRQDGLEGAQEDLDEIGSEIQWLSLAMLLLMPFIIAVLKLADWYWRVQR